MTKEYNHKIGVSAMALVDCNCESAGTGHHWHCPIKHSVSLNSPGLLWLLLHTVNQRAINGDEQKVNRTDIWKYFSTQSNHSVKWLVSHVVEAETLGVACMQVF